MDRQKQNDPFWDFVEREDGAGAFKCKFCGFKFAATTSISRVKWHLSGVKGRGVRICELVPEGIQDAARAAIDGPPQKKLKAVAGSSNNEDVLSPGWQPWMGSITHEDFAHMLDAPETTPRTEEARQEYEVGQPVVRGSSHERLLVNQDEPRGDSSQPTDPLCLTARRYYGQHCTPSVNNDVVMNDTENIVREPGQPVVRGSSGEGLQRIGVGSRGDAFLTKKLVGGEFAKNKNDIWSWLMNDEASSSMGIYGMGGVGKTTLLKHIYNLLLETPNPFRHFSWITVSQDFGISKLQNLIAKDFGLALSSEDDVSKRAAKLSKQLSIKKQWVLILDDLWDHFEFVEVGIPVQVKGCKLILTTRSLEVCRRMFCQRKIKVEPLPSEEAWTLFMETLGHDTALPLEVEQIAKSVARECAGLPLGIITMAATMRGVVDIHEWSNVLGELEESRVSQDDMDRRVFQILKISYTNLKDSTAQQCFLYCSLFPEDYKVNRNDLIDYLIDEGVIDRMKSRKAEFHKGHAMLNKLQNVCLLERSRIPGDDSVMMHDLIRDMAIRIQQENSQGMVKAGAQLKEVPDAEKWAGNLVRVSLMENQIQEIPSSLSPRCPALSTLFLRDNGLRFIAESFFKHLVGLQVLDLSKTHIVRLPAAVTDLVSLNALLLKSCHKLTHVPSFKKLKTLKRLDLSWTALEKAPQGMECLSNLRYLRMNGCGEREFPSGILPKLSHLQVLIIEDFSVDGKYAPREVKGKYAPAAVKGKEVACLRKLETLECHFEHLSDLTEYLKSRDEAQTLTTYQITVGD